MKENIGRGLITIHEKPLKIKRLTRVSVLGAGLEPARPFLVIGF